MKKIIAAIQRVDDSMKSFAEFSMNLARDVKMPLQLVATQSITARQIPAIVGVGIPKPDGLLLKEITARTDIAFKEVVIELKKGYSDIDYDLDFGVFPEKIKEYDQKDEAFMWLLNRRNDDGFFSQVFGTIETDISNESNRPVLNIPESTAYTSPRQVVIVLSVTDEPFDLKPLLDLQKVLGFNTHYIVDLPSLEYNMDKKTKIKHLRSFIGDEYDRLDGIISIVPDVDTAGYIDHVIEEESPDWLAFHKDQKSIWHRLFSNDNINHYILRSQRPVMVF